MPWTILWVLFAGVTSIALLMQWLDWWKGALIALVVGGALVPLCMGSLAFWPALYAPWVLGVVLGAAIGAVAREERLTALLLLVSAAAASVPPLLPYQSATNWQPPWNAADVLLITFIELFALCIFTWLAAALLLVVLLVVVAAPVNLAALLFSGGRGAADGGGVRRAVNDWFRDRTQIVFGILGVVSEVGATRAEREQARVRFGANRR